MDIREEAPASSAEALQRAALEVFGIEELRPGQQQVMERVLAGKSTLAVMPTGAGKSLCFQVPAVLLDGCTLVVSPLIALMKDQREKLLAHGVAAVQLNSHSTPDEIGNAERSIADGTARIVLTTPERLADSAFQALLLQRSISLVVVDEAHCIARWGHDFRPAFLEIAPVLRRLGQPTILALTATASADVAREVMEHLGIPPAGCIDTGTYRPNLHYAVEAPEDEAARQQRLLALVAASEGSGIVYTATVAAAEAVHALLAGAGHSVGLYHGRRGAAARREAQEAFMAGDVRLMVATNAFGMGIDKPDIRSVWHYQMPAGLDAYYQESGRAGRDGNAANCVLLFLQRDRSVQQFFIAGRYPAAGELDLVYRALVKRAEEGNGWHVLALAETLAMSHNRLQVILHVLRSHRVVSLRRSGELVLVVHGVDEASLAEMLEDYRTLRERDRAVLEGMVAYAQSGRCRWQMLLAHLEGKAPSTRCGTCDSCLRMDAHAARMAQPIVLEEAVAASRADVSAAGTHRDFEVGASVKVKRYGPGTVVECDALSVTIEFPDGDRRCFDSTFVTARPKRDKLDGRRTHR